MALQNPQIAGGITFTIKSNLIFNSQPKNSQTLPFLSVLTSSIQTNRPIKGRVCIYESGVYSSITIFMIVGSLFDSIHMHTEVITRSWSAIASTQTAISLVNHLCFAVRVGGSRLRHSSSEYWKLPSNAVYTTT